MAEADRIAAALAYQEQMPAMLNPNLARQGARGRANMMPPTSIMDERYPAFKRNQEDVEKLMLGVDLVGSAIPLAGPAMKGAKVLGQHAAPQIAQALENYAFKTGMALPMDVWHGSPHRFAPTAKNPLGEFDPTKIGTGEGAQAYGYGHYLAENPVISKGYAKTLSENRLFDANGNPFDPYTVLQNPNVRAVLSKTNGDIDAAIARANETITRIPGTTGAEYATNDIVKLQELKKAGGLRKQEGNLYKVDLPDEVVPRMLDWDKTLSEQPAEVKKFLSNVSFNPPNQEQKIGEWLKPRLAEGMAPYLADDMRKAGIPGIQYLDAGSRGASTGTRNFVVFPGNEGLLNILGRE